MSLYVSCDLRFWVFSYVESLEYILWEILLWTFCYLCCVANLYLIFVVIEMFDVEKIVRRW